MEESQKHYSKCKKSDTRVQTTEFHLYETLEKKAEQLLSGIRDRSED